MWKKLRTLPSLLGAGLRSAKSKEKESMYPDKLDLRLLRTGPRQAQLKKLECSLKKRRLLYLK